MLFKRDAQESKQEVKKYGGRRDVREIYTKREREQGQNINLIHLVQGVNSLIKAL